MREIQKKQRSLGQVNIADIEFDPKSRDDIPQILKGLQYIYLNDHIREPIFQILEEITPPNVNKNNGRPGMEIWKIFVMGTLKLNLNCDYDRLHELVNQHCTIREMLGHSWEDDKKKYHLQTIKDNVALFTPSILDRINVLVVKAGQKVLKKKEEILKGRCDSFVVKTDVHYPTDCNLLFDAMRKILTLLGIACCECLIEGWRKYKYQIREVKKLFRKGQNIKSSKPKTEKNKKIKEEKYEKATKDYLKKSREVLSKSRKSLDYLKKHQLIQLSRITEIEGFVKHAERQIEQIERRILKKEEIPHKEKVFSLFEPHTEWINKGKAGVPVELGLKVCVMEDQNGFILHHKVMKSETDEEIAIFMVRKTKEKFSNFKECSFDKGFWSPSNKIELEEELEKLILPKKGKLNSLEEEWEKSKEFLKKKHQHSAVESGINALQVHGLSKCKNSGEEAFEMYVSMGVLSRNIQKLGAVIINIEKKKEMRRKQVA